MVRRSKKLVGGVVTTVLVLATCQPGFACEDRGWGGTIVKFGSGVLKLGANRNVQSGVAGAVLSGVGGVLIGTNRGYKKGCDEGYEKGFKYARDIVGNKACSILEDTNIEAVQNYYQSDLSDQVQKVYEQGEFAARKACGEDVLSIIDGEKEKGELDGWRQVLNLRVKRLRTLNSLMKKMESEKLTEISSLEDPDGQAEKLFSVFKTVWMKVADGNCLKSEIEKLVQTVSDKDFIIETRDQELNKLREKIKNLEQQKAVTQDLSKNSEEIVESLNELDKEMKGAENLLQLDELTMDASGDSKKESEQTEETTEESEK